MRLDLDLDRNEVFADEVFILADKHKLAQVIRNLTSNALKFTPTYGSVTVSCELVAKEGPDSSRRIRIHFTDTGAGISKVSLCTHCAFHILTYCV